VPIESATYIHQLDAAQPAATDQLADADNHLRMIKATLKATFPNITGPVTLNQGALARNVPIGLIALWSGTIATIPAGWVLCSGGTHARTDGGGNITAPNLQDRFVVGAGSAYNPYNAGGSLGGTFTSSWNGEHAHSAYTDAQGYHSHGGVTHAHVLTLGQMPYHAHSYTDIYGDMGGTVQTGGGGTRLNYNSRSADTTYAGGNEAHAHGISADGSHAHNVGIYNAGGHNHTVAISDWRPPWFALAYIMKI